MRTVPRGESRNGGRVASLRHVIALPGTTQRLSVSAVDAFDPLAGQAENLVETSEFEAGDPGLIAGQIVEDGDIVADFPIQFPAEEPADQAQSSSGTRIAGPGKADGEDACALLVPRNIEDIDTPADHPFAAACGIGPPMVEDGVDRGEAGGPVIVEQIAAAQAQPKGIEPENPLARPAIAHPNGVVIRLVLHHDFVQPLQIVAKSAVDGAAVFDFIEVVHGQL